MKTAIWLTLVTLSWGVTDLDYLKGFDDSVLYKIDWPGPGDGNLGDLTGMESMMVTTHDKEKYTCYFPKMDDLGSSMDKDYDGPTPMDLLMPLFASSPCTIMIDIYWSYELCHGKYIRQFHDAVVSSQGKNGHPQVQTREYFLGYWNSKKTKALLNDLELQKASGHGIDPPIKKIEGIDVPYFQVNYTDGTLCDLTGGFRRSSILYVCILGARSDVFIIKEVTTCEYEIIVTRSELCKHPLYRPKQSAEKDIKCLPAENSPHKPTSLARMEADLARNRIHKEIPLALDGKDENVVATFSIEEYVGEDGHTQFRISLKGLEDGLEDKAKSLIEDLTSKIEPPSAKDFLEGRFCPTGKSRNGEWVYTFCFGKHVRQTHNVDGSDSKTSTLGIWDETAHIMWMKRKAKSPSSQSFSTSYFYGNGDICQETGKPKETEVRLKCTNAEGVSLFILEPRTCQYIVGIESSMICEFINKLDQHGLLKL